MKPKEVFGDFYSAHSLSQIHGWLNDLLHVALTSENDTYEEAKDRFWIAAFVAQLGELVEAGYELSPAKLKKM